MVVCSVIQLLEGIESLRKIGTQPRGIVVSQRTFIEMVLVVIIEREVRNLLQSNQILRITAARKHHTLGLLMTALVPANRFNGWISNEVIV